MKKLVFLIAILFSVSCSKQESTTYKEMKSDKFLSEFFTDNEIEDFAKIVDFFESEICLNETISKTKCYEKFSQSSVENNIEKEKFDLNINILNQQELYKKLDTSFLKEIWIFYPKDDWVSGGHKFTEGDHYRLNIAGKYFKFLKKNSNKDEFFKGFYNSVSIANDICFSCAFSFIYKIPENEYKPITRRLFFAVYYLTLNEQHKCLNKVEKL